MKRIVLFLMVLLVLASGNSALAAKARGIQTDTDSMEHEAHLWIHLGSTDCFATGNYLKVRSKSQKNAKLNGHLEQADTFILENIENGLALIRVTHSADSSPDSYVGLTGWVDTDYIDCPCVSTVYSFETDPVWYPPVSSYEELLVMLYRGIQTGWQGNPAYSCPTEVIERMKPDAVDWLGYTYRDINRDGTDELVVSYMNDETFVTSVDTETIGFLLLLYTIYNGKPVMVTLSADRFRCDLRTDGSIVSWGSDGAGDTSSAVYDLVGSQRVLREEINYWGDVEFEPGYENYTGPTNFYHTAADPYHCTDHPMTDEAASALQNEFFSNIIHYDTIPLSTIADKVSLYSW